MGKQIKKEDKAKKGNRKPGRNPRQKDGYKPKMQGMQGDLDKPPYQEKLDKGDSSKDQRRTAEIADTAAKESRSNPVEYYTKFSEFARDAANLPFAKPLGSEYTVALNTTTTTTTKSSVIPGLMAIRFAPAIGISKDFSSAINRSSIRFYTYLRSNQKASATYDHQDVTMMILALDSCYMYHALMRRCYGIMNAFTPVNKYYAKALVRASGFDFEDIDKNLQDFRGYINAFAYQLGQYALPASITLFDRHKWMCEGMYMDGTSKKAQTYMFVPQYFYKYDNTVATGSELAPVDWMPFSQSITHTFAQVKAFGDALLNAISADEDFALISGDIYNFYGGKMYSLEYVQENYSILPTYQEVVLSQIENLSIVGNLTDNKITQNPSVNNGAVIFNPTSAAYLTNALLMNFHKDSPSPEDVIEATRLMAVTSNETGTQKIVDCGTELVTSLVIYTYKRSDDSFTPTYYTTNTFYSNIQDANAAGVAAQMTAMVKLAQFDWAPNIRVWVETKDTGITYAGMTWDSDNFDEIQPGYLENINLACLLSLFTAGANRSEK